MVTKGAAGAKSRIMCSPLTGKIYQARMRDEGNGTFTVVGEKKDVTGDVLQAAAAHLLIKGQAAVFKAFDGTEVTLTAHKEKA